MTAPVDVLAVLNWQVRQAENRCDTARTMRGADARVKERDDLREARAAVAELIDAIRAFRSDQSTAALQRLSAALARVGGA